MVVCPPTLKHYADLIAAAPPLVRDLADDLDATRAQLAEARDVLRALVAHDNARAYDTDKHCVFCLNDHPPYDLDTHAPDCPVSRARQLLGE
jgi:hypothetical protein